MASKQNSKSKKRASSKPKTSARFDDFSRALNEMLLESGIEENVRLSDLPLASSMESFIDEWVDRIVEIIDVAAQYTEVGRAPCGRLLTFMKIPLVQEGWSYVNISALDLRSTTDFEDLQWHMDAALEDMPLPGIAVWIYPSTSDQRMHTIYIRCDSENQLMLVTSRDSNRPIQRIAGTKKVNLIGELIYRGHVSDIAPWMQLIDEYAEDFRENGLQALNELLMSMGLPKPISGDGWEDFSRAMFRNLSFLQLVMTAGRKHARRPMMEAQALAGAIMIERSEHEARALDQKKSFDADRERARARVVQEKEREDVLKKGVQQLVARLQAENASLRGQAERGNFDLDGSSKSKRLQGGFKSIFSQVLVQKG